MSTISCTQEDLARAFTEWERRYREDPDKFWSESEKRAASAESYGEACAPYFVAILNGEE